eukprot:scaffold7712_cov417-Prasinococcus_capsulatus_cf.AAC.1
MNPAPSEAPAAAAGGGPWDTTRSTVAPVRSVPECPVSRFLCPAVGPVRCRGWRVTVCRLTHLDPLGYPGRVR